MPRSKRLRLIWRHASSFVILKQMSRVQFISVLATVIAHRHNRLGDLSVDVAADNTAIETSGQNFHKIIDELLDNAFKFSPEGTP